MASGTAITAPSTAPLPLAGQSTMEPIVPIGAQLGAQDTPSVIQGAQDTPSVNQGARPAINTEQTMQSSQRYSTLPYVTGPPYTAPPLGLPPQVGDDVDINVRRSASTKRARPEIQTTDETKRARSASTSHRSPSPKRDYPRGICTATERPSQASSKRAEHTLTPAQDLEAFKADMTSMLSDMLLASLTKFASQFSPSSGGQGDSAPVQTVASEPTVDVASIYDDAPQGPEDQSEGEIIESKGFLLMQASLY